MMRRLLLWGAALGIATSTSCMDIEDGPWPVVGSSYRISAYQPAEKSEINLQIFSREQDCYEGTAKSTVEEADKALCAPRVDRASGQVHLGFMLLDSETRGLSPQPLQKADISLSHDNGAVLDEDYELIPHGSQRRGQLFILLIDGSGSMYGEDRKIDRVKKALLNKGVVQSFYPSGGVRTGVVLLRFSDAERPVPIGSAEPTVIEDAKTYRQIVRDELAQPSGGYTHLYGAVRYAMADLLREPDVLRWLEVNSAQPTIVALTDGFNNEAADDTCASNAPRLQETLEVISEARNLGAATTRPVLHTVGLGDPIPPTFKPRRGQVSAAALCGARAYDRIDGGLEEQGIDNASLKWMAEVGGGITHTGGSGQLASVFEMTAAERYDWYEVYYRVDPTFHRRPFTTEIRLNNYARASSTVDFLPSGFVDHPTADLPEDDEGVGFEDRTLRHSAALIMPLLGLLVLLTYWVPATFNARRAIFRRPLGPGKG